MATILLVDDDLVSVSAIAHILGHHQYSVVSTDSAEEAFRHCRELHIDLVIADVLLRSPITGTELAIAIRQQCPAVPLLFISGTPLAGWSARDFANVETLLPGRVEFLMKPFTADALVDAVSRLLNDSYSEVPIRSALADAAALRHETVRAQRSGTTAT